MFVDHDSIESKFVDVHRFVEISFKKVGSLTRVEIGVREGETE